MADFHQLTPGVVSVSPAALPWSCPPPALKKWDSHPRVVIPLSAKQPNQKCPYCGTLYVLTAAGSDK